MVAIYHLAELTRHLFQDIVVVREWYQEAPTEVTGYFCL